MTVKYAQELVRQNPDIKKKSGCEFSLLPINLLDPNSWGENQFSLGGGVWKVEYVPVESCTPQNVWAAQTGFDELKKYKGRGGNWSGKEGEVRLGGFGGRELTWSKYIMWKLQLIL